MDVPEAENFIEPIPLLLPSRVRLLEDAPKEFVHLLENVLKYKRFPKTMLVEDENSAQERRVTVMEYRYGKELTFVVNPLAKEFLDKITEPFAIMSITGPLRSGKSTFLSHVVNFLRKNEPSGPKIKQNFEVSNKTRCCTVGIWLFPQLLTLSKDGGGDGDGDDEKCKKVLLLDVEGLYGNDSINGKTVDEEGYFLKMFAITSFLSSVVLFNRTINLSLGGNDFQELEKLSAAIKALGDKSEVLIENKPHLVYLARNYNELKSFEDDSKYWSKTLENSRTPKQFRNFFNMKFRKHSFVTFVDMAPLRLDLKHHRDLDQYPLQDLNPDFVKKFTWFMETHLPNILKNLCIKTPDCPEEEIYVSGNFYNLVVRLVQGISDQTEKLDMDEIIRIAKEGEAKREFSKRIKSVLESISSIELPSDWTNKLYPEIETLIFQQASELNMFLEGGGLTTRFSPDQWLADSDIKKKILEVCGNNDMQITQKLSKYWNKQKEEAYQTLEPSSLENWFHVTLLQEDQHLQSLLLPEISKRMQEFHNTKTKEALDLENATYVKIYTTVLSSVKVSIIDIPKTEEGCFTQIRTEPLSYETLDRILSFLKSPPSGPSFGLNAAAEYTSAINQMGSLHKKRIDELMGGFLDNLKICLTERIALMRKDIIDKVSTTLLCPHLMSAFTFKEVYDPDYKNFVVYLKKLVSINSHLNLFVLRRILNEKVATITNNYSTQEIQPISLEELKKFINLVVDTVTGEIPRINQQIRLVWTQDNEKWRKWFSLSNLNIIRESPVELRMADRGTEEELSMPDKPTDRIYILTLDSPETVQRALHPKIVPPRFMKLQRVKSYHVVITNAKQLDPKRLDYIASLPEGTAISEPKYLDDLCLLDFATKKEKFCLLEQGSISVGSEHEYRFLDTYKADCTDDDLKKWEKYLISFTRTENKIRGEFWPVPEVMENPSPVVDEIPEEPPNMKDTLTEKKSVTSSRGTRSDSESSFPINPSVSIIPGEYFRPSYNSIQDLIPEISSNLRTYIWDPICCRVVIQTKKALTEEKEVWRDPYLCSYRILVAATTMVACNLMRYSIVPKEYLKKVLEEDPLAHDKSYDTLAREGKIREIVTVSLPAEKGPTNPIQLFPITTPRISNSTRVTFEQLDTLVCAEMLLSNPSTGRLLVLNMANEHRPGGGWTSGKIAQEEELFRRSNISKILLHSREFYPIPEYSALCSKNVTVFRGVEEEGYAFLEKPFLVDVVSLCAYDANNYVENGRQVSITTTQMNKSRLRRKVVVKTYRKLVTLLHFAIQEGYQTILLGALGCGAFKNPPADIAAIFLEVITQYGGFVPNIVFSILGNVNYDEFKRVFQKEEYPAMMEKPITPEKFDKLCTHGGVCYDLEDEQHASSYFHPPPCPLGKDCPNANDLIHSACNHHPQKCQRGVGCPRLLDENHKRMTIHPPLCKFGIKCKITEENHFLDEWHPPNCEKGLACQEYKDHNLEHITQYRHLAQPCAYGLGCREFHDSNHMQTYCHPFLPLCPKYLCCNDNTPQHRNAHSHVCTWGGSCQELGNENHVLHFYHFMNHDCPAGSKCTRGDELHLNTCSHPKIRDIRPPCKEGPTCPHKNQIDHFKTYSHPPPPLTAVCPINPLIMDLYDPDATIAKAAEEFQFRIPFWDNTQNMLIRFEKYRTSNKIDLDLQSKSFLQIVEWFRDLRPVHRLNKDTFVSVLKTGAFLSIHQLKSLAARDENLVPLVLSHPIIVPLLKKEMKLQDHITNFIRSTIRVSLYEEKEKKKSSILLKLLYWILKNTKKPDNNIFISEKF